MWVVIRVYLIQSNVVTQRHLKSCHQLGSRWSEISRHPKLKGRTDMSVSSRHRSLKRKTQVWCNSSTGVFRLAYLHKRRVHVWPSDCYSMIIYTQLSISTDNSNTNLQNSQDSALTGATTAHVCTHKLIFDALICKHTHITHTRARTTDTYAHTYTNISTGTSICLHIHSQIHR